LGGEPGHFKECGQRRGECLPVVRVELADQGGQATDVPCRRDSTILAPARALNGSDDSC
jgi:hypothetical protein